MERAKLAWSSVIALIIASSLLITTNIPPVQAASAISHAILWGVNTLKKAVYLGQYSVTAYACPEESDTRYFPDNSKRVGIRILKQDLKTVVVVKAKISFINAMNLNGGGIVNSNPQKYNHTVQREYLYGGKADFREVDQVSGAFSRVLVPLYSAAILRANKQLRNGDTGYFVIKGSSTTYNFRVDDTGSLRVNQIDYYYGIGKQAYSSSFYWGVKQADLYRY